jgi:glycosyltransferase involved in cell wall biosynthesis
MQSKKLRILFNDAHANLPWQSHIPQGGPSRFASVFSRYFMKKGDIELISLLFSHNVKDKKIFVNHIKKDRSYYELIYPRDVLRNTYTKNLSKKDFLSILNPFFIELDKIFVLSKPDVVFLNGYNLTNWMFMETAHRNNVPVVIQHAGIWKKELAVSQRHFSSYMRRLFNALEKEIISKSQHQIFLNDYSRHLFFNLHGVKLSKKILSKTSVIPLPADTASYKKMKIENKGRYKVGMVGRWDNIKNHPAIYRLAAFTRKKQIPLDINVVTHIPDNSTSQFKKKYEKVVNIYKPMLVERLNSFIDNQNLILVPSKFDVSPTIVMESVINGRPALISGNTGWLDLYNKYGLKKMIVKPSISGSDMYKRIIELMSKRDLYLKKFEGLQKHIRKQHKTETVLAEYYKIFKSV